MRILSPPRADCPIAQESTLPNAQARNEPVWVFVSAPEFLHNGEPVMEWVQQQCENNAGRARHAFMAIDEHRGVALLHLTLDKGQDAMLHRSDPGASQIREFFEKKGF